jgi:YD repeat-containing protein
VLGSPTNLSVTAALNTSISLSWTSPGGAVDHYQVERSQSPQGPFTVIANPVPTNYPDNAVISGSAYLYRVRAVDSSGMVSAPSTMALGTAITFQDDTLVAGTTPIKKQHIYDLRQAVNAVRALGGLSAITWTDADLTGLEVKALHVQQLRDKLDEALVALNVPVTAYQDSTLATGANGTPIKKIHIEQLRQRSTGGSSTSTGSMSQSGESALARLDPANETGGGGENPLSRNYNLNIAILGLSGRAGLDLGLSLAYNSLVWTKSGSTISFDDDGGFPSPGFRLGFPVIQPLYYNSQVGKNAFLLIGSDGSRTELRQVNSSALYEAADSSYLLLDSSAMILRTLDGTQLSYVWKGIDYQCTQIEDRNGNFITINYTAFGRISTLIDTLGRTITFNYDGSNYLTSITQLWNGQSHPWASFEYYPVGTLQTNFQNLTTIAPQTVRELSKVTLNDGSRFEFDYTSWGQIWKVRTHAADGHQLNYRAYNLPGDQSAQTDCPRFTERHDWAENFNRSLPNGLSGLPSGPEQEVFTASWIIPTTASWALPDGTAQSGMLAQVTQPADGTYNKIYFASTGGTCSGWCRGLPSMVETYDSGNVKQRQSVTLRTQDDITKAYPLNPRVTETDVYDPAGNRARTTVDYSTPAGTSCKLPSDVVEFQANGTIPLRRSHTSYNSDADYINRRIIGLVNEKTLYQIDPNTLAETLMSSLGFIYDQAGSIQGNDAPVQHYASYNQSFVLGRANLTMVKRFEVNNLSLFTNATIKYNTAGAAVASTSVASTNPLVEHTTSIVYTDNFSDGNNSRGTFAYPTQVTDAGGFIASAKYNFDFGAVTRTQSPPPAGQTVGGIKNLTYDTKGRLEKAAIEFNGNADYSHTRYEYSNTQNRVDTYTTIEAGSEARSFSISDGYGRVFAGASSHPGSIGGFSGRLVLFNKLGQAIKSSNPTETNAPIDVNPTQWEAKGDDATAGWLYTQETYDWKGRPLVTTNADGTTKEASYAGCGCAGGQVVTLTDEGTIIDIDPGLAVNNVTKKRQQKIYNDTLGRTVKTEVLNWDGAGPFGTGGSVYSTTVNTYNARDQVTIARQYQGPESVGIYHETTMTYDGYGRLQTRHVPEQKADTSISGSTDHTTWIYNDDDTVKSVTDARGITIGFGYNSRNLLISIDYPDTLPSGIPATADVTYEYDAAGNRTSISDPLSSNRVDYLYDSLSRLTSEARHFPGLPNTYTLAYQYNLAGQVKTVADQTPGTDTSFSYTLDTVGRPLEVNSTGLGATTPLAANAQYRASGALKHREYGNGTGMNLAYNSRGMIAQYSLSGVKEFSGGARAEGSDYQYHADGRVKFASDFYERQFSSMSFHDKSYQYDQAGRVQQAFTAVMANDFLNGTASQFASSGPYLQTNSFDAWDNLVGRDGLYWNEDNTVAEQVYEAHNRNYSWSYDADGRLISMSEPPPNEFTFVPATHTYDAAGRHVKNTQTISRESQLPGNPVQTIMTTIDAVYDGDGHQIKRVQTKQFNSQQPTSETSYYLSSSVLGGRVVTEYDSQGADRKSYVYSAGELIASGSSGTLSWLYNNPVTGNGLETNQQGGITTSTHVDPEGVETGATDPASTMGEPPPPQPLPNAGAYSTYLPHSLGGSGSCSVDGMEIGCGFASSLLEGGAAEQCTDNECSRYNPNARGGRGGRETFQAFADGWSGYLPDGISYVGDGLILNAAWTGGGSETIRFDDVEFGSLVQGLAGFFSPIESGKKKRRRTPSNRNTPSPQGNERHGETVYEEINDVRGGSKLSPCARYIFGKFGFGKFVNLDQVRVHIGIPDWITSVAKQAGGIIPKAITIGDEIYWRSSQDYQPSTVAGLAEVGHELTHVSQYNILRASFFLQYLIEWAKEGFRYPENQRLEKTPMEVERLLNLSIPQRFGNDPCKDFRH